MEAGAKLTSRLMTARTLIDDPLGDDQPGDAILVITRRSLARVALVAAETGMRFQREEIAQDPFAWMETGNQLFAGLAPIDACLSKIACTRAILAHGLRLNPEASPKDIAACMLAAVAGFER